MTARDTDMQTCIVLTVINPTMGLVIFMIPNIQQEVFEQCTFMNTGF